MRDNAEHILVDGTARRARSILADLVAIPSISHRSNGPMIEVITTYLSNLGVTSQRIPYADGKYNLLAVIGPDDEPGLVLSGHTDVVPVEGQTWKSDPFTLTERDGKLFGRGSADMKGFLAICLALVPEWLEQDLQRPVILAFSCDEEIGCRGVLPMIDALLARPCRPAGVIVGEPTELEVVTREKGNVTLETLVTGAAAHSADPAQGLNAITIAARLIGVIDDIAKRQAESADPTSSFVPPYSTINIGLVQGGVQKNIVPDTCRFRWECRPLPSVSHRDVLADFFALEAWLKVDMRRRCPTSGIETTVVNTVPGLAPSLHPGFETLVKAAALRNGTGAASFASEAGHFQHAGFPTIMCGPGSIGVAHKADEYISLCDLADGIAYVRRLVALFQVSTHHFEERPR